MHSLDYFPASEVISKLVNLPCLIYLNFWTSLPVFTKITANFMTLGDDLIALLVNIFINCKQSNWQPCIFFPSVLVSSNKICHYYKSQYKIFQLLTQGNTKFYQSCRVYFATNPQRIKVLQIMHCHNNTLECSHEYLA